MSGALKVPLPAPAARAFDPTRASGAGKLWLLTP